MIALTERVYQGQQSTFFATRPLRMSWRLLLGLKAELTDLIDPFPPQPACSRRSVRPLNNVFAFGGGMG
jgi:hypothetical protein